MKKILLNNMALKIASVLIAFVIWYVVVKTSDPIVTRIYTVPVTVENEQLLKRDDKTYTIYPEDETIDVRIRDNESNLDALDADDIKVIADLTQSNGLDEDPITVYYQIEVPKGVLSGNEEYIRVKRNVRLQREDLESSTFAVEVTTKDTQPAGGYVVGKTTPNPPDIDISGPASVVSKIGRVSAAVDVSGLGADTTLPATLTIYDKNGDAFTDQMMGYLTYGSSDHMPNVSVDVELWKVVNDVKLEAQYTGKPESGYQVKGLSVTPDSVTVAGSDEELAKLEGKDGEYALTIAQPIDVSGRSQDTDMTIQDITTLVPQDSDIRIIVGNTNENATKHVVVRAAIMPVDSKEFSLSTSSIKDNLKEVAPDLQIAYNQENVMLRIQASEDLLSAFDVNSMVAASIDLSGMKEGDHSDVPVSITLPGGYTLLKDVKISFKLQKKVATQEDKASDTSKSSESKSSSGGS